MTDQPPPPGSTLADLADELAALTAARAAADAAAAVLAERVDLLEQLAPAAAPAAGGHPYRYDDLPGWVDEVFARLAAGHRAKWCTNWQDHAEAAIRLRVLWHTWEAAMAAPPGGEPDWAAVDDWIRLRLDHHAAVLLDVDGPFAGCIPARGADRGRCAAPPRLPQRPLRAAHTASLARLEAVRGRTRPEAVAP